MAVMEFVFVAMVMVANGQDVGGDGCLSVESM
jgi:hypothetical protein